MGVVSWASRPDEKFLSIDLDCDGLEIRPKVLTKVLLGIQLNVPGAIITKVGARFHGGEY